MFRRLFVLTALTIALVAGLTTPVLAQCGCGAPAAYTAGYATYYAPPAYTSHYVPSTTHYAAPYTSYYAPYTSYYTPYTSYYAPSTTYYYTPSTTYYGAYYSPYWYHIR